MRRTARFARWAGLMAAACLGLVGAKPADTSGAAGQVYSELRIRLGLKDGRLVTVRDTPCFFPSAAFDREVRGHSGASLERELLDLVDKQLEKLGPVYRQTLPDEYRTNRTEVPIPGLDPAPVRNLTTNNWRGADASLRSWAKSQPALAGKPIRNLPAVYADLIARPDHLQPTVGTNLGESPLVWRPAPAPPPGLPPAERQKYDAAFNGLLHFDVVHLRPEDLGRIRFLGHPDFPAFAGVDEARLGRLLRGLGGQLWWAPRIKRILDDYFVQMGYAVADGAQRASPLEMIVEPVKRYSTNAVAAGAGSEAGGSPWCLITSPPKLSRVVVEVPFTNRAHVARALGAVLPSDLYDAVRAHWERLVQPYPSPTDTNQTIATVHLRGPEAILLPRTNLFIVERDVLGLVARGRSAGFQVVPSLARETGEGEWVAWRVVPLAAPKKQKGATSTDAGAPSATAPGSSSSGPPEDSARPPTEAPAAETAVEREDDAKGPAHRPNSLRFQVTYSPRQPLLYEVSYSRVPLSKTDNVSGTVGVQREVGGELSYEKDFLAADRLGRRWSLKASGWSHYEADRLDGDTMFDERRTGGSLRSVLEVFHDLAHQSLSADFGGRYEEIEYLEDGDRLGRNAVFGFDVGAQYVWVRNGTPTAPAFELTPRIFMGHSQTNGDWYVRPEGKATWHQLLPWFLEWDSRASVAWVSTGTPAPELCRFGGEESVRGYRVDAGLGRLAWSVQNELWLPLRFGASFPEGVDRLLRRSLHLAAFVDVGGVHQTGDDFAGVHAGAGVGLRFHWQLATLRLDWAHALESTPHERGGSVFYFSASLRPSL